MKIIQGNFLVRYFTLAVLALGASPAFAQVSISVNIAPPPLQVDTQPACPEDGYLWTPGYWAYENNAYYWVPGAWVQPPQIGELWTPPYWGWDGSAYAFYQGYWGPNVGFYGGVNYGYGYGGKGYGGGRWEGGRFSYNTAVNNVSSANFHNTYVDRTAINSNASHVSYNGGSGGLRAQPTSQDRQYSSQHHAVAPPAQQDTFKPQAVPTTQGGSGASFKPPIKPETQAPSPSQETPVKSHDKPEMTPQTHSAPPADTQSHSGAPNQPQSHPEAPAKP